MKPQVFKYKSLHEYLESVLKPIPDPTHAQIKEAKREYWKLYYLHYRREKRKIRKEFTLAFNRKNLSLIHAKKGNQSVSQFLYQIIHREISSETIPSLNTEELAELHLKLMQIITLVEELLESNNKEVNEEVLERLETLEDSFSQFINS